MTFLTTLTFTNALDVKPSPLQRKRSSLIRNLRDQLILLENPNLFKTRARRVESDGCKQTVNVQIKVRPWWRETIDGKLTLFIKSGLKRIEFEKGQTAILVSSKEMLPALMLDLITAVENGELDKHLIDRNDNKTAVRKKAV
jgi:hypothetical protein